MVVGIGVTGAGIVLILNVAATWRWDHYAAKLRESGGPLTFEEIEAARAEIPDELNGALVIERLHDRLEQLSNEPVDERVFLFTRRSTETDFFTGIPRDHIEPSREFLEPYRDLLEELAVLRSMPSGRFELDYDPKTQSILEVGFPDLKPLRAGAKLLHLNAMLQLIDGDSAGAVDSVRAAFASASTLNEHPTVIGQLVQIAIDALGIRALEETLRVATLDDETLRKLVELVERRQANSTMRWGFAGERAMFLGLCEELLDGSIPPNAIMLGKGAALPFMPDALIRQNQIRGVEILSRLVDARDDPELLVEAARRINSDVPALTRVHYLVRTFLPSLSRAVTLHLRVTAYLASARVALAAERFRLATGELPDAIAALVPEYLDKVPTDPFDGEPMRFAETAEGIVIYSVSEDLNDDGGIVTRQKTRPYYLDVGFRLNRPEHRGLLLIDDPLPNDD